MPVVDVRAIRSEDNTLITEIEGFAAAYGNVDSLGEIIDRGAFDDSVAMKLPAKQIKLLADHNMYDCDKVLGLPLVIEDREMPSGQWGLYFKAMVSAARSAQDTAIKLVEGIIDQCSVGTRTTEWAEDENGILHNVKMTLYDISIVPYAANTSALITGARSEDDLLARLRSLPEEELQRVLRALGKEEPKQEEEIIPLANENEVAAFYDTLKSMEA